MMICTNCGKMVAPSDGFNPPDGGSCPHCRMNGALKWRQPDAAAPDPTTALPSKTACRNCGHALDVTAGKCPVCRFPAESRQTGAGRNFLSLQTRIFN